MSKKIYLLMGPSGCGKTTLGEYFKELGIPELISHTTRPMRDYEINGVHYYFVNEKDFFQLDFAESNDYPTEDEIFYYGISKQEVSRNLEKSDAAFAVVELNGVKQLKESYPDEVVIIFVTIPLIEMEKRMRTRGDSEKNIEVRLNRAIEKKEHDHGFIADYIINNWDLEESKKEINKILKENEFIQ